MTTEGKPRLHRLNDANLMFECPGCGFAHRIRHAGSVHPVWTWNGSMDKPTFHPSIKVTDRQGLVCHSFVTDGQIKFLSDCTHKLAGQTVELPEWS